MICKLDKVSIRFFVTNPRYQTNKPRIRQKIAFFEVKCRFEAFSHKAKNPFFVEYSTGIEISTVKFLEKKVMMFVDIPYKYLGLIPITYENIKKVNCIIFFFNLTVVTWATAWMRTIASWRRFVTSSARCSKTSEGC